MRIYKHPEKVSEFVGGREALDNSDTLRPVRAVGDMQALDGGWVRIGDVVRPLVEAVKARQAND